MNRSAANSGIFPSMPITDALSIQSNCLILEKSMLREQCLEQILIKELRKFSPWISKKTNNSFILNITGCSHLFNGEKEMAKKISLTLKSIGLSSSIGIGDSPSSAMAPRPGRIHKEYNLPFAEMGLKEDLREIKKNKEFSSKREEILSMIWNMEEEIMGKDN